MQNQPFGSYRNSFIVREALRIAPVRPNFSSGFRAALATTLPLVLAPITGHMELVFASLAGFSTALADKGGPYRVRALSALSVAVFGGSATVIGSMLAEHTILAALLTLVVVSIGGFVRMFGAEAIGIGTTTSVSLVLALARPASSAHEALRAGGGFLIGCAWAALLALVVWPLRPYRPVRLSLRNVFTQLALVADSLVDATAAPSAQVTRREQLGRTREAIENARRHLAWSRSGRPGPSQRGMQLLALLEGSDRVFGALIALEDELTLTPVAAPRELRGWVNHVAPMIAATLRELGAALDDERPIDPVRALVAARSAMAREVGADARLGHEQLAQLVLLSLGRVEALAGLARAVDDPMVIAAAPLAPPSALSTKASPWSLVRDHLTVDSAVFRHAVRMGISTALALLAMHALHIEHGYWATLTCLVILQPHGAATWAKALQRVIGTIFGALVAVAVASLLHDPRAIVAAVFVFILVGMALLPLNYGAFSVFLTPAFVLLAETHPTGANMPWMRVLNTLIGAVIALLGSRLLFPLSERDQIRPVMGKALASLRVLLSAAATAPPNLEQVRAARRQLGMTLLNAEASYQRLLTETGIAAVESEALLTLLLYAHRLGAGLITLATAAGTSAHAGLVVRAGELAEGLDALLEAVVSRSPSPTVILAAPSPAPEGSARVATLFEHLAVLRAAAGRWNARSA